MPAGSRTLRFIGVAALIVSLPIAAVAAWFAWAGTIQIQVDEPEGSHIRLHLPAALVEMTVPFLPKCARASSERNDIAPLLRIASRELARMEDGVLVDVRNAEETVRIAKEGRTVTIRAESPDETVFLSMPVRTLGALAGKIEAGTIRI